MKTIVSLLAVAALALSSVGCQSTNPGSIDYGAYVPLAVAIATNTVIQKGTSPQDKKEKARLVYEIGDGLLLLADDTTAGADIANFVLAKGGNKSHWQGLALALAIAYDTNTPNIPNKELVRLIGIQLKKSAMLYIAE